MSIEEKASIASLACRRSPAPQPNTRAACLHCRTSHSCPPCAASPHAGATPLAPPRCPLLPRQLTPEHQQPHVVEGVQVVPLDVVPVQVVEEAGQPAHHDLAGGWVGEWVVCLLGWLVG